MNFFFHVYFCVNQARKDRFWIFQIQKNDFWAVNRTFKKFLKIEIFQRDQKKTTFIKIQNIEFFVKGLVHTFFQKIQLFLTRDFWANQARENHFFNILDRIKCILVEKSELSKKSKKSKFSKRVSLCFLSKNPTFSHVSF